MPTDSHIIDLQHGWGGEFAESCKGLLLGQSLRCSVSSSTLSCLTLLKYTTTHKGSLLGARSITAQAVPQVSWSARLADTELVGRLMASRLAPEEAALSAEPALLAAATAGGLAVVGGLVGGGSAVGLLRRTVAVVVVVVGLLAEVAEGALEVFLCGYSTIS